MVAKLVLDKKREGRALGSAEIRELIEGYVRGEIPDCQMSAFAMAVCCRGMTVRETADLTEAMRASGRSLTWEGGFPPTADKHSTGGVGDKISLVSQPLAAACGLAVPSLAGRGLGLTGGTIDKLESIPGFRTALSLEEFQRVVREAGVAIAAQTDEIAPADKKLYALRDVTGTVPSIPLITASILSKKLAEGAGTLVFDVKCGAGAFMRTADEARQLAGSLVDGARAAGRRAAALVTDMSAPLGRAVGNANEVAEALAVLGAEGYGYPKDGPVAELSVELAANMVALAKGVSLDEARAECRAKLADGSALARFEAMVSAQGGDLTRFRARLAEPLMRFRIQSVRSGCVTGIDAERVGRVALTLGAGRQQPGDRLDLRAGIDLAVARGERVSVGTPLATLFVARGPERLEAAAAELLKAFSISSEPVAPAPTVLERL